MANRGAPVPGAIHSYAGSSVPSGWLFCDGSAVSRTTYASLFSTIGVSFGPGDGSTTFNLPNSSGLFLRSSGSQVVSAKTFDGGSIGAKTAHTTAINGLTAATSCTPTIVLQDTDLAHTHALTDFYGSTNSFEGILSGWDALQGNNPTANQADNTASALTTHNHTATYGVSHVTTISSTDTETAPAALSTNFIIKY